MLDVLPKVQGVDDAWATGKAPSFNQMNLQFCSGNDLSGHGKLKCINVKQKSPNSALCCGM